jgi:hypothetical protein
VTGYEQVEANHTGAPILASMHDFRSKSAPVKALMPAIKPDEFARNYDIALPAPARDISTIAYTRVLHRGLRTSRLGSCSGGSRDVSACVFLVFAP